MHPRLFQLGHLVLPTYGVVVAAGLIGALLILLRIGRVLSLDTDKLWNVALLAIVMTTAGIRLLPVLINWRQYGAAALAINFGGGSGAFLEGSQWRSALVYSMRGTPDYPSAARPMLWRRRSP